MAERTTRKKIGQAMAGFGAGFQGRGGLYLSELERQRRLTDEERRQAVLEDALQVQQHLQAGDPAGAQRVLLKRRDRIVAEGGDPSDTIEDLNRLMQGDVGLSRDIDAIVNYGYASNRLQTGRQPQYQTAGNQLITIDPATGQATASSIQGYTEDPGKERDRNLRERQIKLQEEAEQRQATKLSAGLEKVLLESQQSSIDRQGDAINFMTLSQEFENRPEELGGGVAMTVNEALKALLGTQDDVTELRRKINAIRVAEGIGQLPPGVASDKDIELVMSGQSRENASPEQVSMYLRGAAKAAQYAAGYNQMRVDYINRNRKGAGLNQAWRKMWHSPRLGRNVAAAEIYRTAMLKGIPTDQVMRDFGIEGDLLGE